MECICAARSAARSAVREATATTGICMKSAAAPCAPEIIPAPHSATVDAGVAIRRLLAGESSDDRGERFDVFATNNDVAKAPSFAAGEEIVDHLVGGAHEGEG